MEREREETVSRLQSQLREATTSAAERDRRAKAEQQGARDAQKRLQKDLKASEDRVRQAEGKARKAEEEAKRMRERNAEVGGWAWAFEWSGGCQGCRCLGCAGVMAAWQSQPGDGHSVVPI